MAPRQREHVGEAGPVVMVIVRLPDSDWLVVRVEPGRAQRVTFHRQRARWSPIRRLMGRPPREKNAPIELDVDVLQFTQLGEWWPKNV